MKVKFKLSEVDLKNRKGLVRYKKENSNYTSRVEVSLSPRLARAISNHRLGKDNMLLEDIWFESEFDSPIFKENPFKLVWFRNPDGTTHNYHLKFVTEGPTIKERVRDRYGKPMTIEIQKDWEPHQFQRLQISRLTK